MQPKFSDVWVMCTVKLSWLTAMCRKFEIGHTDIHDAGGQGRKQVSNNDFVQQMDQAIRENRQFTIFVLSDLFPEISRSTLYTIVTETFHYRKLCARWLPKMLSDHHKTQWMGAALTFLQCYHDGEDFLNKIVTGDGTWVHFELEETKYESKQWMHSHSPSKRKKFRRTFSNRKCKATVFWNQKMSSFGGIHGMWHDHHCSPIQCDSWMSMKGNSEQATRNVVIRHCVSSWKYSAVHCNCNKEAPAAFLMGSVWSPTIQPGPGSLWISSLS